LGSTTQLAACIDAARLLISVKDEAQKTSANETRSTHQRLQLDAAAALRKQIMDSSAAMQGGYPQCPRARRGCSSAPAIFGVDQRIHESASEN
jgi:hypothetical protein